MWRRRGWSGVRRNRQLIPVNKDCVESRRAVSETVTIPSTGISRKARGLERSTVMISRDNTNNNNNIISNKNMRIDINIEMKNINNPNTNSNCPSTSPPTTSSLTPATPVSTRTPPIEEAAQPPV